MSDELIKRIDNLLALKWEQSPDPLLRDCKAEIALLNESNESLRNQNTYLDEKLAELENELRVTDENLAQAMKGISDWDKMIVELRGLIEPRLHNRLSCDSLKDVLDKWNKP